VHAPLKNVRWSWGAERSTDGAVFLRVWQDLKFIDEDGRMNMLICSPHSEDQRDEPGYRARSAHGHDPKGLNVTKFLDTPSISRPM
jgi:hypothetical protein